MGERGPGRKKEEPAGGRMSAGRRRRNEGGRTQRLMAIEDEERGRKIMEGAI